MLFQRFYLLYYVKKINSKQAPTLDVMSLLQWIVYMRSWWAPADKLKLFDKNRSSDWTVQRWLVTLIYTFCERDLDDLSVNKSIAAGYGLSPSFFLTDINGRYLNQWSFHLSLSHILSLLSWSLLRSFQALVKFPVCAFPDTMIFGRHAAAWPALFG